MTTNMMQRCSEIARRMMLTRRVAMPMPMASPIPSSSSTCAVALASAMEEGMLCGRGDKKTKRGKRFKGSYGNARPKRKQMIQRIKDKVEVPRGWRN
ncbi:hypothetical protein Dimus_002631 [Dionaea muscipula]